MTNYPPKLAELVEDFAGITDRNERVEALIEIADRFPDVRVPADIASKPYAEENHVQYCESDAYVWAQDNPDGTVKFYFDVLNPQGLSAMAMAVVLDETLSGAPLEQVAKIDTDIVFKLFGREISMGKGQGLMGIIAMVRGAALDRLNKA
ncbi:MAG: SufE family protein [Anaerolineae bacterium]|jgi:sulfur transfer protein SufE|nr:SufE family protein [Anaerolineae bacterium]